MDDELVDTEEAADILGMGTAFLQRDRVTDTKVPFIQVGSRSVRYSRKDLQEYISKQRHRPEPDFEDAESEYEEWD